MVERALLVGLAREGSNGHTQALLAELKALVETLGIAVVGEVEVRLSKPQPRLMVGSGKAAEIIQEARLRECDVIIFDDELSPAQQRNWEKETGNLLVIDRQEVILDIFAARATTREARLQVELARMEYNLPRLRRAWSHLGRQRGGVLQRGEGETQLELDRRMTRQRISRLKEELVQVIRRREIQRRKRTAIPLPTGAIVGYTNAGKSSLLNSLTEAGVLAEDKVFATLDPTSRRLDLKGGQTLILTDTVGFVRKLPHGLVEAFKATLEEAAVAQFLLHVVDVSNEEFAEHIQTTEAVLEEIGIVGKPTLLVFNKVDRIEDPAELSRLRMIYPDALFISARRREGMEELREHLIRFARPEAIEMDLLIPHDRYDVVSQLHRCGAVKSERYEAEGIYIRGRISGKQQGLVADFVTTAEQPNGLGT